MTLICLYVVVNALLGLVKLISVFFMGCIAEAEFYMVVFACVCACQFVCVRACVFVCVCACVRACVCVHLHFVSH